MITLRLYEIVLRMPPELTSIVDTVMLKVYVPKWPMFELSTAKTPLAKEIGEEVASDEDIRNGEGI